MTTAITILSILFGLALIWGWANHKKIQDLDLRLDTSLETMNRILFENVSLTSKCEDWKKSNLLLIKERREARDDCILLKSYLNEIQQVVESDPEDLSEWARSI